MRPPQQIGRGADHGEQIVEIMRNAAGELAERFQPLAVLQRFLGVLAPGGLGMQILRSPQGQRQEQKQQRGGGQAENQMLAHGGEPARADRRGFQPGADIDRILGEPVVADPTLDAVGRRRHRDEAGLRIGGDLPADRAVAVEAEILVGLGKARQHVAVGQAKREETAGLVADPRIEILKVFRKNGSLDHAGKAAVLALPAPAHAEKRRALVGRPRCQGIADMGADVARDMRLEIIAVGEIDVGRRRHQAVGQGPAPGIEDPGRFHLRQRRREPRQALMQRFLARPDALVRNAADDLGNFRQAAVDGLEYL